METKEMHLENCCKPIGRKKKFFFALALVAAIGLLGLLALKASGKFLRYGMRGDYAGGYGMMQKGIYPSVPYDNSQFVTPGDALKSGEIAIVVSDLEAAKKSVTDIATKEGGNVYATFIAYASGNVKNGSMVVQIPVDKFEDAFSQLKMVGTSVIQESTQQIPQREIFPIPMAASSSDTGTAPAAKSGATDLSTDSNVASAPVQTPAVQPIYYPQQSQDKGYIRIIFADYGKKMGRSDNDFLGVTGYQGLNMRDNIWVVLAVKSILLIVLFAILIFLFRRIFGNLRKIRNMRKHARKEAAESAARKTQVRLAARKSVSRVVHQAPKTRSRVVRIAKRK